MDWIGLISSATQVERENEPSEWEIYPISDFEKDYKSIISSAAFRRIDFLCLDEQNRPSTFCMRLPLGCVLQSLKYLCYGQLLSDETIDCCFFLNEVGEELNVFLKH